MQCDNCGISTDQLESLLNLSLCPECREQVIIESVKQATQGHLLKARMQQALDRQANRLQLVR